MKKALIWIVLFSLLAGGALGDTRPYIKDVQSTIQSLVPENVKVDCQDGANQFGREIKCGIRLRSDFSPREAHDLQAWARAIAIGWREADTNTDFSITAFVHWDVPIARFIYSHKFDQITPLYMWR